MDKILEFEKEKFNDGSKTYRFQCDCLEPEDAMDIEVDSCGENGNEKYITITMKTIYNDKNFWNRLKDAFKVVRGNWCWGEFCVRKEDFKNLSDIFDSKKEYDELP